MKYTPRASIFILVFLNTLLSLLLFASALKQTEFTPMGRLLLCHRYCIPTVAITCVFRESQTTTVNPENKRISSIFFLCILLFHRITDDCIYNSRRLKVSVSFTEQSHTQDTHAYTYLGPKVNRIPTKHNRLFGICPTVICSFFYKKKKKKREKEKKRKEKKRKAAFVTQPIISVSTYYRSNRIH